jgi:RNA polymerase sigma-70 factor (ECF subfamily)
VSRTSRRRKPDRGAKIEAATVVAALQSVDETFRAPLTLVYPEDLSCLEIAGALGVPIGTVMSRLSRGKRSGGRRSSGKKSWEEAEGGGVVAFNDAARRKQACAPTKQNLS